MKTNTCKLSCDPSGIAINYQKYSVFNGCAPNRAKFRALDSVGGFQAGPAPNARSLPLWKRRW